LSYNEAALFCNKLSKLLDLEECYVKNTEPDGTIYWLCDYEKDKLEFSDMKQITAIFRPSSYKLAAMVEIGYGYPVDRFPNRSNDTVDMIRLVVWKRMIPESVEYAKSLLKKGYEVSIQATRTDQYTLEEFAEFVKTFSSLSLTAIYIVDTFGLMTKDVLLKYVDIADCNLSKGIRLGYHAHNNMQQAFSNMLALVEHKWNHNLIIDASVMGIGRGAGNLCLELFEKYLNENQEGKYLYNYLFEVAERYIKPIFQKSPWGYSIPYLLSAQNGCNPSFVSYLLEKELTIPQISQVFEMMRLRDCGVRFDTETCDKIIQELFFQ